MAVQILKLYLKRLQNDDKTAPDQLKARLQPFV